jgi:hypothetical protein
MCAAAGLMGSKLPIHTPTTAAVEYASGGRSPDQTFKESTVAGKILSPKISQGTTPASQKKAKVKTSKGHIKRTGGGLRANNTKINTTGLQLT